MYKLVNVNNPKLAIATSNELVTLWKMLDNKELAYKTPVIVNDDNEIIAGSESAYEWAKLKGFSIKGLY